MLGALLYRALSHRVRDVLIYVAAALIGTIIGTFLERSGGAFAMAEAVLRFIGGRAVPLALNLVGYVVSIPVFADSGFVILLPLTRALTKRAALSLATTAIRIAQGSATVTIITTASILAPLLGAMGLDSETGKALTVLAIGAGSFVA